MDLGRTAPVSELRAGPALPLSTVAAGTTLSASAASAKTAASRAAETATGTTAWSAETSSARTALSAKISFGTSGAARPTHHHAEIGLRILRQALAQATGNLKGLAAALAITCGGRRRSLRCRHFALQLRFKLIASGLPGAHAGHALRDRRFLHL
jgi:hypothetical protein